MTGPHDELAAYLEDLRLSGRPVPCVTLPSEARGAWTSDDPSEQSVAARACVGCAGFAACRAYIDEHPAEWGVYAAITDAQRHRRPGRPRKAPDDAEEAA